MKIIGLVPPPIHSSSFLVETHAKIEILLNRQMRKLKLSWHIVYVKFSLLLLQVQLCSQLRNILLRFTL